ncbi:MAG: 3-methyl-2-oxobutanoate hydroxymethyltransferase, partial [Spirochaetales bacterium]|nr:3-methyl-2-oxobutanoate hydroxymethyltransferase [Spirochaetales bacterium]
VKLEGGDPVVLEAVEALVPAGIPVMGHLGLTPQSVNTLGGYRVQGKDRKGAEEIRRQARELERSGCFALVLECVPPDLGRDVAGELTIPVIGIGAGAETDGQVLVIQDLLGQTGGPLPRFVRSFARGDRFLSEAVESYCRAVTEGSFPCPEECYGS